jgi:hypothetical protein
MELVIILIALGLCYLVGALMARPIAEVYYFVSHIAWPGLKRGLRLATAWLCVGLGRTLIVTGRVLLGCSARLRS